MQRGCCPYILGPLEVVPCAHSGDSPGSPAQVPAGPVRCLPTKGRVIPDGPLTADGPAHPERSGFPGAGPFPPRPRPRCSRWATGRQHRVAREMLGMQNPRPQPSESQSVLSKPLGGLCARYSVGRLSPKRGPRGRRALAAGRRLRTDVPQTPVGSLAWRSQTLGAAQVSASERRGTQTRPLRPRNTLYKGRAMRYFCRRQLDGFQRRVSDRGPGPTVRRGGKERSLLP